MPDSFSVETTIREASGRTVPTLDVAGTLDATATRKLDAAFTASFRGGIVWVILNLPRVDYISSAGLRLLLKFRKDAIAAGGGIKIAGLRRDIRENCFDALGFSKLIDIYSTVDEALNSIPPATAETQK
jgi:anti-anti-sigma factor